MKNWIVDNFWIKIASLILAIVTWLYVNGELSKMKSVSENAYKSSIAEHAKRQPALKKKQMNRGYVTEKK
ncbi:hypothetical protein ACFL0P_02895 [Candidatus Omnitrophota bacterium]